MATSPVKIWRRQKEIRESLGKEGKVLSWTFINIPPLGFSRVAPYAVALVEFEGGGRAFGQVVDCAVKDMDIGMRVKSILRRVREADKEDVIAYGLKFRKII